MKKFIYLLYFSLLRIRLFSFFVFYLSLFSAKGFPQQTTPKIDSIQTVLAAAKANHKVDLLIDLCKEYRNIDYEKTLKYAQQANTLAEQLGYTHGIANSYMYIGLAYHDMEKIAHAQEFYFKAKPFFESLKDKKEIATIYNCIGNTYINQGNYKKALEYHLKALSLREEFGDKKAIANSYNNIGNIYSGMANYLKALTYHLKSLKIKEEQNDTTPAWQHVIAMSYINIGRIYSTLGNFSRAEECFLSALKIYKHLNEKLGEVLVYNGVGGIYEQKQDESNAIIYYLKALKIAKEVNEKGGEVTNNYHQLSNAYYKRAVKNKNNPAYHTSNEDYRTALDYAILALELSRYQEYTSGVATSNAYIGNVYRQLGKYDSAITYLNKAMELRSDVKGIRWTSFEGLYLTYKEQKKYKEAFDTYQQYVELKDSLVNTQNALKIEQMGASFEEEKKEKERELMKKMVEDKHQLEIQKQRTILISVIIGLFFFLIFSVFIYRSYRQKQKANIIITQQKAKVENAYKIIEQQKKIVEEHNKDITDSINYAKRIQTALLASDTLFKKNLPGYFVLYKPKDIVSGDFYWATEVIPANDNKQFLLCTGDCTGHGVPGAFMSLLNISKLNETINEKQIARPDLILNNVREEIVKALNPENATEACNDGMDCTLLAFDFNSPFEGGKGDVILTYSAANNPIYIIRNKELIIGKADKIPVGKSLREKEPFTLQTIELFKGDTIYTLTDGYADQFGGKQGKKFKYKQLEELLLACHDKPMIEQKKILNETIEQWKGSHEQVDDMLIIGIQI